MKHKLLIMGLFGMISATSNLQAQSISVNAGANISDLRYNIVDQDIDTSYGYGTSFGFRIGGDYTHNLNENMGIEAGLYFSQRNSVLKQEENNEVFEDGYYMNYIDVPVNFKYGLPVGSMKINLRGGLNMGLALSGRQKGKWESTDGSWDGETWDDEIKIGEKDEVKRMDFGFNIGAGVEIGKILVNLNYNRSLTNIVDMTSSPEDKSSLKWSVINITLGYKLM